MSQHPTDGARWSVHQKQKQNQTEAFPSHWQASAAVLPLRKDLGFLPLKSDIPIPTAAVSQAAERQFSYPHNVLLPYLYP